MRDEELKDAADSNYAESMRILVEQACANGRSTRIPGMLLTSTGTGVGWLNLAFVLEPLSDPTATFGAAREFYAAAGEQWLMRVPGGRFPEVQAAAEKSGFQYTEDVPGMTLYPMPEPAISFPIEIRPVNDAEGARAFASILGACFGIDEAASRELIAEGMLDAPDIGAWLGYADDAPVASSMLIPEHGIAGIWCIGTLDGYRGKGIGEAVTRRAVDEGTRRGCKLANLQASAMGRPVYERMGFREVSSYLTYLPEEIWGSAT